MNIEYNVILVDKLQLLVQQQVKIYRIILSLRVKSLDLIIHDTNEYILILIYILANKKDNIKIFYRIFKEIYLISNLKAYLLINNDIIDLEKIVLNIA